MATRRAALAPAPTTVKRARRGAKAEASATTRRRAAIERRYHQRVQRVDVWSVLKISVIFYLCALIVLLAAGTVLWVVADSADVIGNVESFLGEILDDKTFHLLPGEILRAATLLGLVFVCVATIMTVLAAAFYNLFSEIVGGIEITVVEDV